MISNPIPGNNDNPEPLDRNLGREHERIARAVNARHAAGQYLREYRRRPTLEERFDELERRCERLEALYYDLLRIAA